MRTALYRHFAADGTLLYVGISLSPIDRLSQHMEGSRWAEQIARIEIEWHDDRADAERAERAAIMEDRPRHNRTFAHSDTKLIVYALVEALTPEAIMDRLGVSSHSIRAVRFKCIIPACWYGEMVKMCDAQGIFCDTRAFAWAGAPELIERSHARRFADWRASRLPTPPHDQNPIKTEVTA